MYNYAGLPLTPTVFSDLTIKLVNNKMLRRAEIINIVTTYHSDNGGLPSNNATLCGKKALKDLHELGQAKPGGVVGFWIIGEYDLKNKPIVITEVCNKQFVYAYYFPAYRELAKLSALEVWPHKIGMTTSSTKNRITSQVGTALPEQPIVALEYECSDATGLEKALHYVLTSRGKKMINSPGAEWYSTNEAEITSILNFIAS